MSDWALWLLVAFAVVVVAGGWFLIWIMASAMDRDLNRRGIREHFTEHPPQPGDGTLAGDMEQIRRQVGEFWRAVLRRDRWPR